MKKIMLALLGLLLSVSIVSCSSSNDDWLGDSVDDIFTNGYVSVQRDGLWGFIDEKYNEVIEPQYLAVSEFSSNGYAVVKKVLGSFNFINTEGQLQLEDDLINIQPFIGESTVCLYNHQYAILHDDGQITTLSNVLDLEHSNIENRFILEDLDGTYTLIDDQGNELSETYEYIDNFKDGSTYTIVVNDTNSGVINSEGIEILEPKYQQLVINVVNDSFSGYDSSYGMYFYVDAKGNDLLPSYHVNDVVKFMTASSKTAAIYHGDGDLVGYINQSNKVIIDPYFIKIESTHQPEYGFLNGFEALPDNDDLVHIYNDSGKKLYDVGETSLYENNDLMIISYDDEAYVIWDRINQTYLVYRKNGDLILESEGQVLLTLDSTDYILEFNQEDYTTNIYDYSGKLLMSDLTLLYTMFINGMIIYSEDNEHFGIMNKDLEMVINPMFNLVSYNDLYNKDGYIILKGQIYDSKGNGLLENPYQDMKCTTIQIDN